MTIPTRDIAPSVTTGPLPASRKIYVTGSLHPDIRVPMREISTHPTAGEAPLPIYDSSGPYTDPDAVIDVGRGLPPLRLDHGARRCGGLRGPRCKARG